MKPFSTRLNHFVEIWYAQNREKFIVYNESQFNFDDIEDTFQRFTTFYKETGCIPMWFDTNEDNIFADTVVNAKFRAWHDYTHILLGADFSLKGEISVYAYQQSLLPLNWEYERQLMYCEIVKQAEYYSSGGKIIKNQRQFTRKYLKDEVNNRHTK